MTLTIGRVPTINEPMEWNNQGDQVEIRSRFKAASPTAALILREQLLGYDGNVDEPIVPIISSIEPRLTGFYRIHTVAVPTTVALIAKGELEYTLQAERMPGFGAPLIESTLIGGLIPNAASIALATSQPWHAVPGVASAYSLTGLPAFVSGLPGTAAAVRTADDGALGFIGLNTANYANKATFQLPPANFYTSAAQAQGGVLSSLYPLVGRQVGPIKGDWRITNGLVRVQSRTQFDGILISWYNGSTWSANHGFTFGIWATNWTLAEGSAIRILRNSPEEVAIRLSYATTGGSGAGGPATVDLALRRGARVVPCFLAYGPLLSTPSNVVVAHAGALACTAITGGIRATANDADGNRPVLTSAMTVTNDLVNGSLTKTTGALTDTFDFGIGNEIPGATGTTGNTAQHLVYQYVAGQAESQRVVGR